MRCSGTCVTGKQCKRNGNPFCTQHWPFECGVCLEKTLVIQSVKIYCGHVFCQNCLFRWIIEKQHEATCPLCRSNISEFTIQSAYRWGKERGLVYYPLVMCYSLKKMTPEEGIALVQYFQMYRGIAVEDSRFKELVQNFQYPYIFEKLEQTKFGVKLPVKRGFLPNDPEQLHTFY